MSARRQRSVSPAILLGSISVVLAIAMLVAWILALVLSDLDDQIWLLVLGIISLSIIGMVLAIFMYWLVREIRANRRQISFIDSVTHELKTPLASLRLCLETLDRTGLNDTQQRSLRHMMRGDVDRLASFIDDVLVANRVGPGMEHAVVPVALAELARRCADRAVKHHDLDPETVTVDVPDDLVLRSDPTAVETICLNLIDNALKYSDRPVQVRVMGRVVGRMVQIAVADHGIGMSARDARRVFQRFFRVDSEDVRRRSGTGLGLFVVAGLVRSLRGRISASSPGVGRGTTITVQLPLGGDDARLADNRGSSRVAPEHDSPQPPRSPRAAPP